MWKKHVVSHLRRRRVNAILSISILHQHRVRVMDGVGVRVWVNLYPNLME